MINNPMLKSRNIEPIHINYLCLKLEHLNIYGEVLWNSF